MLDAFYPQGRVLVSAVLQYVSSIVLQQHSKTMASGDASLQTSGFVMRKYIAMMLHVKHLLPLRLLKIKVSARKPIFGTHLTDLQFDGALHALTPWHDCQVQIFAHRIAVCLVLNPF